MLEEYERQQKELQAQREAEEKRRLELEAQQQREFEQRQLEQAEAQRLAQEQLKQQQQQQMQQQLLQYNNAAAQRVGELERELLNMQGQFERDQLLLEQYDRVGHNYHVRWTNLTLFFSA
jgi:huntingtin-interacting protein 1-related protein